MRLRRAAIAPAARPASLPAGARTSRRGPIGCTQRMREEAPGHRRRLRRQLGRAALRDQPAAALAGTGTDVDDVVGRAYRVLVVLDDDQCVALVAEVLQRTEQHLVVARVQPDRRLVEHIADALQVAAELRREPDALRLAAATRSGRRGRGSGSRARPPRGTASRLRISLITSRAISLSRAFRRPESGRSSIQRRASATDHCAIQAIEWPSNVTPRDDRVQPRAGADRARLVGDALDLRPPRPGSSARGRGRRRAIESS